MQKHLVIKINKGSYKNIVGGRTYEAIRDLTGAPY